MLALMDLPPNYLSLDVDVEVDECGEDGDQLLRIPLDVCDPVVDLADEPDASDDGVVRQAARGS